jgi:hypothetical protein
MAKEFAEMRVSSCYVTTNLGVGSSNLSGRAKNVNKNQCVTLAIFYCEFIAD